MIAVRKALAGGPLSRKQADGSYLLVIPEFAATSPNNHDNPVTVIRLPANFDRF